MRPATFGRGPVEPPASPAHLQPDQLVPRVRGLPQRDSWRASAQGACSPRAFQGRPFSPQRWQSTPRDPLWSSRSAPSALSAVNLPCPRPTQGCRRDSWRHRWKAGRARIACLQAVVRRRGAGLRAHRWRHRRRFGARRGRRAGSLQEHAPGGVHLPGRRGVLYAPGHGGL